MAKYHYPYQKIVDLKTSEKTQAEWMLSAAIGRLQEEELSLEQLESEQALWLDKLQSASSQIISLSELQLIQTYLGYLDTRISKKNDEVRYAKKDVEHKQSGLSNKLMDEKVWLKAKEQALGRFVIEMQTKEQNELDEMATVRFMVPAR
jgi:flagellar FliJ protein